MTATPSPHRNAGDAVAARSRVVIEGVAPQVDGGRFPVKRVLGDTLIVEADGFADGHDQLCLRLRWRHAKQRRWEETAMEPLGNDRWRGVLVLARLGRYHYTLHAWIDPFLSWRHDFARREDEADIALALLSGAELVQEAAGRARARAAQWLKARAAALADVSTPLDQRRQIALEAELLETMQQHVERGRILRYERELEVLVDPPRAACSAWYELFPRSCGEPGRHGTFADVEARLPYVKELGFDVLYLPPIHPIGEQNRKGPNNSLQASAGDPGSPWAIGSAAGGHKAVHPELGTLADFRRLVRHAARLEIDVALDIAFQCAPDHPYVREHPQWFRWRPDGTVQYAENPPKKYQDIYPFDFECTDWRALWEELKSVLEFWVAQGVSVFRVDNPHTKSMAFWEWAIGELKREHPQLIFLAEAFTRPKVMKRLAKVGFSQSYTYFAWRHTREEFVDYLTELTRSECAEYMRPNFWPNTPDILTEHLQHGGRGAFATRLMLAATLSACYGIYGPAFELLEHQPREPGSEEYLDSEKYQLRHWNLERPDSLRDLIARINRVRRAHPALQTNAGLHFHATDNPQLLCYSKCTPHGDRLLMVANLDPHRPQSGWTALDMAQLVLQPQAGFVVHDLLGGERYRWQGPHNYVALDPQGQFAHILHLESAAEPLDVRA